MGQWQAAVFSGIEGDSVDKVCKQETKENNIIDRLILIVRANSNHGAFLSAVDAIIPVLQKLPELK